jgi:hypothetical protein
MTWHYPRHLRSIILSFTSSSRDLDLLFRTLLGFLTYVSLIIRFRCFSSLFAASKNFPEFIGMASGACAALFSLSPMLISILASRFFSHPDEGLDVIRFLRFLAVTCGAVHLFGGFTLHIIHPPEQLSTVVLEDFEWSARADERTALLQGTRNNATEVEVGIVPVSVAKDDSIFALFKDHTFWVLAFIMFVTLGSVSLSHLYHPPDGVDFCWQE